MNCDQSSDAAGSTIACGIIGSCCCVGRGGGGGFEKSVMLVAVGELRLFM